MPGPPISSSQRYAPLTWPVYGNHRKGCTETPEPVYGIDRDGCTETTGTVTPGHDPPARPPTRRVTAQRPALRVSCPTPGCPNGSRTRVGSARSSDRVSLLGSGGTLYSLSREGEGSSAPLVTALTAAVLEAAEAKAAASVGGRLALPLLAVLDEVANVCRWRELPDLYSHYGSRGIVVLAVLQSWAQGEGCWENKGCESSGTPQTSDLRRRGERLALPRRPFAVVRRVRPRQPQPDKRARRLVGVVVYPAPPRLERRPVGRHAGGSGRRQPLGHAPRHRRDGPVDAPARRFASPGFACPLWRARRSPVHCLPGPDGASMGEPR